MFALHLAAPVVLVTLGATVVAAGPRAAANWFFALFLAVVAGNQLAGAFEYLANVAGDPGSALAWRRAGFVLLALDPFLLLYFASLYPRRSDLNASPRLLVVGLASASLVALAAFWPVPAPRVVPLPRESSLAGLRLALAAFMFVAYCVAYRALSHAWARETDRALSRRMGVLLAALGAVIATRFGLVAVDLGGSAPGWMLHPRGGASLLTLCVRLLGLALGLVALRLLARGPAEPPAGERASVRRLELGLAACVAGVWTFEAVGYFVAWATVGTPSEAFNVAFSGLVGGLSFSSRWLLFGALVGYAILRDQVFDLEARLKRGLIAAELAAVLVVLAIAALVGLSAVPALSSRSVPLPLALSLLLAAGGIFPLLRFSRRAAERMLPQLAGDEAQLAARRLAVYRTAIEDALAEGRPVASPRLVALRKRLRVTDVEHDRAIAAWRWRRDARARSGLALGAIVAGRYEVVEPLGAGSGGRAFLATDRESGRAVALKVVRPDSSAVLVGRLVREAAAMRAVRHANVATLHDVARWEGATVLVMEYASGGSLADRLRRGRLPLDEALRLADGLLAGLEAAHAASVVHRDLKPSNVLLAADGTPWIADFGVARLPDVDATRGPEDAARAQPGTIAYMSPEQAAGQVVDHRADLYAAALVIVEALTGEMARDVRSASTAEARATARRGEVDLSRPEIPRALRPALARALAPAADSRYASASEMRRALREAGERALADARAASGPEHEESAPEADDVARREGGTAPLG